MKKYKNFEFLVEVEAEENINKFELKVLMEEAIKSKNFKISKELVIINEH